MASVASVFNLFRRNNGSNGKWHEVRWRNGPRHIVMSLRFAVDGTPDAPPAVERLSAAEGEGVGTVDDAQIVEHIRGAVAEYNRMNLCNLRVASVRVDAAADAEPIDYGTATRKMLNLL